jgi:hypothetical protein
VRLRVELVVKGKPCGYCVPGPIGLRRGKYRREQGERAEWRELSFKERVFSRGRETQLVPELIEGFHPMACDVPNYLEQPASDDWRSSRQAANKRTVDGIGC